MAGRVRAERLLMQYLDCVHSRGVHGNVQANAVNSDTRISLRLNLIKQRNQFFVMRLLCPF
jgi:hypothetical protein